jgi:predicted permease
VVLVLAMCIGANTALFTVVNALLLKPLPFPHSERLVAISTPGTRVQLHDLDGARSLELTGAYEATNFAVAGADGVRMAYGYRVSADLIPLLQVQPAVGRALTRADFRHNVVMAGYDYWKSLGEPQNLKIDGQSYAIAGVLPPDFFFGVRDTKLIVPNLPTGERTIARLHAGIPVSVAQTEIASLWPGSRAQVTPLASAFHGNDSRPIVFLLATAGFVLLIACANLANLQLVRGIARRRELAIRAAMGGSYGRLLRQLAGESASLTLAGTAAGLLLTRALHDVIPALIPGNISRRLAGTDALALDWHVLAFTCGIGAAANLLFGLLPALSTLRFDIVNILRDAARGGSRERQRFGQALVTVEIALALMLLAGASVTFKNLTRLEHQYLGFRPESVLRAMTDFPVRRYTRPEQKAAVFAEAEHRIHAIPGVANVGIVAPQAFPFGGPAVRGGRFEIFGRPDADARAEVYAANPGYLDAIRLPLLRGRWFTAADTASGPQVAVIGAMVARRYWADEECVGRTVRFSNDVWATIVGVVGDVKNPIADLWQPTAYRPFAQTPYAGATLTIRTSVPDPLSVLSAVRRELHAIDPDAPEMRLVATLDSSVRDYVSPQRFTTRLVAVFAAIGLALAATGVYGVMRYWVASRTGEIGIRVALGAQRTDVLGLVLGHAALAAAAGIAAGVAGAMALRKVIVAQLTGVDAADPMVLGLVAIAMFAVAVVAAWVPARRAAWIDPAEALRTE